MFIRIAAPVFDNRSATPLPHLPRAEPRVMEAPDQRLGERLVAGALAEPQAVENRLRQVEIANSLRRPVGADLRTGHSPYLLGIALEEQAEQPLTEAVAHPVLETPLRPPRAQPRRRVAGNDTPRLDHAELGKGFERLKGIGEELVPKVDPGQARSHQHVLAHPLAPPVVDQRRLGKEPVPADVEPEIAEAVGRR
ncbi:MAG: hypothetical protein M5U09_06925 [Gammaproteobacteria bacterium]|nr:hypothetical protein [Gammaproteobacteria bacterium]